MFSFLRFVNCSNLYSLKIAGSRVHRGWGLNSKIQPSFATTVDLSTVITLNDEERKSNNISCPLSDIFCTNLEVFDTYRVHFGGKHLFVTTAQTVGLLDSALCQASPGGEGR